MGDTYNTQNQLVQQSPSPLYPSFENNNYSPKGQNMTNQPHYQTKTHTEKQIIIVQGAHQSGNHCAFCGFPTETYVTRANGCLVWTWFIVLFLICCLLCWIPFVVQSCKDQQFRCKKCGQIKNVIPGKC